MFSKSLENLIEATLVDGVLTDQEKEVLVKRAQKEGVDVDELDVYIQSILQKRQQAEAEVEAEKAKKSKIGQIRRCPNCGAVWVAGTAKCQECGYEYVGVEAVSSSVKFAEGLAKLSSKEEIKNYIENYPVPATKEDLLEFIMTMRARRSGLMYGDSYQKKFEECITKAQVFFSGDPQFEVFVRKENKFLSWWYKNDGMIKIIIILVVFIIIMGFFID